MKNKLIVTGLLLVLGWTGVELFKIFNDPAADKISETAKQIEQITQNNKK